MAVATYKRSLCKFWLLGQCERGDRCTWSHGDEDGYHQTTPDGFHKTPAIPCMTPPAPVGAGPMLKRTLCKFFTMGTCEAGELCTWAHGLEELGTPILTSPSIAQAPAAAHVPQPVLQVTRTMCKFFMEGRCKNGDRCTFAHGDHDLGRPIPVDAAEEKPLPHQGIDGGLKPTVPPESLAWAGSVPPAVGDFLQNSTAATGTKRTICKFWLQGSCERGLACTFAHGSEDIGAPIQAQHAPEDEQAWQAPLVSGSLNRPVEPGIRPSDAPSSDPTSLTTGASQHLNTGVKRTVCKFWLQGTCQRGDTCTWAHGDEDIGSSIESPTVPIAASVPAKKTLCKYWQEGNCQRGDQCTWAHGEEDMGMPVDSIAAAPTVASVVPSKRTICKFWQEGLCQRGDLCTWAHGEEDIGAPVDCIAAASSLVPAKRTICKFWATGACERGSLCTWAHGEEELGELVADALDNAPWRQRCAQAPWKRPRQT